MKHKITKILMYMAASTAVLTFAGSCERGYEYEEDDRYGVTPEIPQFVALEVTLFDV